VAAARRFPGARPALLRSRLRHEIHGNRHATTAREATKRSLHPRGTRTTRRTHDEAIGLGSSNWGPILRGLASCLIAGAYGPRLFACLWRVREIFKLLYIFFYIIYKNIHPFQNFTELYQCRRFQRAVGPWRHLKLLRAIPAARYCSSIAALSTNVSHGVRDSTFSKNHNFIFKHRLKNYIKIVVLEEIYNFVVQIFFI
jgi:hypothetical protein